MMVAKRAIAHSLSSPEQYSSVSSSAFRIGRVSVGNNALIVAPSLPRLTANSGRLALVAVIGSLASNPAIGGGEAVVRSGDIRGLSVASRRPKHPAHALSAACDPMVHECDRDIGPMGQSW